ncbi:hypothetical protein KKF91_18270, partial [Myxococcota bacterium]|nr:hypothetical protein [Myxococcota bacterium]
MIAARALGAALLTPLGGPLPRLTWGLIAAVYLATRRGEALDGPLALILAELLLGAALGLLASLPIYASMALGGEGLRALGRLGPLWAWGIFFSVNGPALWLMGLAQSAEAWPDALTPAPMGAAGTALLYAALLLGAPTWLSH